MGIHIRITNQDGAVLVSFRTLRDRFESDYERNKFFRALHGWEQTVPNHEKRYTYRRPGVLDHVPHMKVADSVFVVAVRNLEKIQEFFDKWEEKVEIEMMEVLMEREKLARLL